MSQFVASRRFPFLGLIGRFDPTYGSPASTSSGAETGLPAPFLRHLFLALVLHAFHLVPVRVFFQVSLAAATGAEAERQVVAFFGPHVLPALLLVPAAGPADAVELHQDAALPLVETLQVHPVAVRADFAVAHHPLVVVLLKVDGTTQTAH